MSHRNCINGSGFGSDVEFLDSLVVIVPSDPRCAEGRLLPILRKPCRSFGKPLDRARPLGLLRLPQRFEPIVSGLGRTAGFQSQPDYATGSICILTTEGKRDGSSPKFIRGEHHGK